MNSLRSLGSDEGAKSLSSRSLHSSSFKENVNLPKGLKDRMKERAAALRATGVSTRSLRSNLSETSSRRSVPSRLANSKMDQHSLPKTSPNVSSTFNRGSTHMKSPVKGTRRQSGPGSQSASVYEKESPMSFERQMQISALQEQILQIQKMSDGDITGESSDVLMQIDDLAQARVRLAQLEQEEQYNGVSGSLLTSPKKDQVDDFDIHSGSNHGSFTNTINSMKTPSSSKNSMTTSMLGTLLTIPSVTGTVESPVSSTSTTKLELIQSYRREQSHSTRTKKLDELRNLRRSTESKLLNMVHNQQEHAHINANDETAMDATDVMAVIVNLRDELSAAQQVIEQQRTIMEALTSLQEETVEAEEASSARIECKSCPPDMIPLEQYQDLQSRFSKLQMDRAWAEYQLRDRITTDALKFHRRLRHWKDQSVELRCNMQNLENIHDQYLEAVKQKGEEKLREAEKDHAELLESVQATADSKFHEAHEEHVEKEASLQQQADEYLARAEESERELEELKKSTQIAFDEFCDAKDRIELLEAEIEELKGGSNDDDIQDRLRTYSTKRLARRNSKSDLVDDDEGTSDDAAAASSYWGTWLYGTTPAIAKGPTIEDKILKSQLQKEEKIDTSKQMLPSRPRLDWGKPSGGDVASEETGVSKATSWGTWGLPAILSVEGEAGKDHIMNVGP